MKHNDKLTLSKEDRVQLLRYDSIFRNNGYDPDSDRQLAMKDTMDLPNAAFMVPRVLSTFVQAGVEPMLIGSNLLQRIEYVPGMATVFPAVDVLTAREAGDGGALPEFNVNVGGGQTFGVNVTRHGLALRVAQRFVEQSTYPWLQWWLQLAGNALARHKEEKIFSFITALGTRVFDNDQAARQGIAPDGIQPIKGHTTGRNLAGKFNGTVTMDDVCDTYAQILMQGFIPDTMLVHPLTWIAFVKDPVLREFAIQAGGGSFFANFTGNANAQAFAGQYNFNGMGQGLGQTGTYVNGQLVGGQTSTPQGLPQNQTSAPILPSYLPLGFRILVSPFVRFDPDARVTDIMMFDSKHLGALIVDEEPHVNSFDDHKYGIHHMQIEESYGFGILNEGQGIATIKNVAIKPSEFVLPARTVYNLSDSGSTFEQVDANNFGPQAIDILAR
jgi:hypothetical protein